MFPYLCSEQIGVVKLPNRIVYFLRKRTLEVLLHYDSGIFSKCLFYCSFNQRFHDIISLARRMNAIFGIAGV